MFILLFNVYNLNASEAKKAPPTCAICLEEISPHNEMGEGSRACSELHFFHAQCLQQHILFKKKKRKEVNCPLCREKIEKNEQEETLNPIGILNSNKKTRTLELFNSLDPEYQKHIFTKKSAQP